MAHDLILTGGRVIDPSQALDAVTEVGFALGKVTGIGPGLKRDTQTKIKDVSGFIVTPGLIDLHTHVYWGGTSLGVDPDLYALKSGVTTSVDTGSAGPGNFAGFAKHVIAPARSRIYAYLHVSHAGIYGFSTLVHVGESEDMRLMDPRGAVEVAAKYRQEIIGIKVRVGRHASGDQGVAPLDVALDAANESGLPLMAHIDEPPPTYEDVLARLRPGDVLTHAFRPFPNAPVTAQGTIKPAVLAARKRGVLFDIGHGMGSFAFKTARAMLANGFLPDTISSDVHALCIDGPAHDLVTTMSKFLCLGMGLNDIIRSATETPARAIKRLDLGTLKPGALGDASLIRIDDGQFDYVDVTGEHLAGTKRISAHGVVMRGEWWA
ncbi:amidohydrolase/deacetylase family metallohydrolase [Taklimakanibacter albus]|uniref:Amidohydrolase/deacetylase family metallohydrolase n=1 Tax=Taklimakanibacter albus TaxID=2800327 RepID=A0ACC5RE51_9HYPH|nr:amidohydrolase/deacetylase family metallohydrolase [Aestuariivirga sp. YIM B02566]MBK1870885.1 amidohydrolase/deacetylase family metallohydrolase [Aestuariivirga sp. YIM B02566]